MSVASPRRLRGAAGAFARVDLPAAAGADRADFAPRTTGAFFAPTGAVLPALATALTLLAALAPAFDPELGLFFMSLTFPVLPWSEVPRHTNANPGLMRPARESLPDVPPIRINMALIGRSQFGFNPDRAWISTLRVGNIPSSSKNLPYAA